MHHERLRRITSPQNALLKQMRKAFSRAELTEEGHAAIEGIKTIDEAIRAGLQLRAVVFSDAGTARADHLLPQVPAKAEAVVVTDEVFKSIVDTQSPQGVAALVSLPVATIDQIVSVPDPFVVMIVGLQDPGNLGTIIRAAEAFGATGAILCEGTVSVLNAKAVRASAGSSFRLPIVSAKFEATVSRLRGANLKLVGTSSHEGNALPETDLRGGIAIVIGNEGAGLSRTAGSRLDGFVKIPHSSKVESLNAAMAASLILYEAARQRRTFL